DRAGLIDAGNLEAIFSAYEGGATSQPDTAQAAVRFLAADGHLLKRSALPAISGTGALRSESLVASLPRGTRTIKILLLATNASGTYNNAYFDRVSVILRPIYPVADGYGLAHIAPAAGFGGMV